MRTSADTCAQIVKYGFFKDWGDKEKPQSQELTKQAPAPAKRQAPEPAALPYEPPYQPPGIGLAQVSSAIGVKNPAFNPGLRMP